MSPERVCRSALQAAVRANARCIQNLAQRRSHKNGVAHNCTDITEYISTGTYATDKQHKHAQLFLLYSKQTHALLLSTLSHPQFKTLKLLKNVL
jgi:hypothetical protein